MGPRAYRRREIYAITRSPGVLAAQEPWGGQMFVDLVIALLLFTVWMRADAAHERLPFWPYFLAILTTGSIGALAYLVHRSLRRLRTGAEMAAFGRLRTGQ